MVLHVTSPQRTRGSGNGDRVTSFGTQIADAAPASDGCRWCCQLSLLLFEQTDPREAVLRVEQSRVLITADARREPPLRISGKTRATSIGVVTGARRSLKDGTPMSHWFAS
jgi:hypothetical protein